MNEIKLCYSFSARVDKLGFIDLLHSLHTAKKWFKKDDIIVFCTPPFNDDYECQIAKYATIIKKEHYPISHPIYDSNDLNDPTPPYYWDKFWFTEMDCDNLIFLDNDTELQTDIQKYFKDDFDITVFGDDNRIGTQFKEAWNKTWKYFNLSVKRNLMTTAILFKHQTHKEIKKELENVANKYVVEKVFEYPAEERLFDEYVFSLSVRKFNVKILPKDISMLWTSVKGGDVFISRRKTATILHGGARRIMRADNYPDNLETFDSKLLEQIKNTVPLKHWIERVAATFLTMLEDIYPKFNVYFELKNDAIIMHTNAELVPNTIEYIMSYVWAEKPSEYKFIVIKDL